MATKEHVRMSLKSFIADMEKLNTGIWGVAVGPAPSQYNMIGKPVDDVRDFCIHAYTNSDGINIPETYDGIAVMIFFNVSE